MLLPVVLVGSLFKETVLCCALLVLFGSHWNWKKRTAAFLAIIVCSLGINRLLMAHYDVSSPLLAMNNATALSDLFQNTLLFRNIRSLFSLNHVLVANAGALVLMMLVPWQNRRDVLFRLVIVVFAAGQFLYGSITEVRVWYEVLPLGWILINEAVQRQRSRFQNGVQPPDQAHRSLRSAHWVTNGVLFAIALGLLILAQLNLTPAEKQIAKYERMIPELIAAAEKGDVRAQHNLGALYAKKADFEKSMIWYEKAAEKGDASAQNCLGALLYHVRQDYAGALFWYRKAADQGDADGKCNLAFMYFNGVGCPKDVKAGIRLYREAAARGEVVAWMALAEICQQLKPPDYIEAYKWLKLAQLKGNTDAAGYLGRCSTRMTPEQIVVAEQRVKEFAQAGKGTNE